MSNNKASGAFMWKLLERVGVQGSQFVLQLILARILSPEHYGVLSIMITFTALASVFVQNGFNVALIQKKKINNDDFSSVFWVSLFIAFVLYIALYFFAPLIADFYNMPSIVFPFRVIALMLFPGVFNSIQNAKITKELNFKKIFYGNFIGTVGAGVISIAIALNGGGLWALVAQSALSITITSVVMFFTVRWRPRLICNIKRVSILFSFGWKILVSSLIETLYQDLRSLVIGKKYDSGTLGYYNRGKQFPQFIISAINGTVQAVMLPVLSKEQDDKKKLKATMRTSIVVSSYVIFPMMAGLAAVATPLITVLLTEKWLPAVPFMMIYCFSLAFTPVHTCNLQAINAVGRSDIYLKLEIIKKVIGIGALVVAVFCFNSPIAIAATGLVTTFISCFINAYPNKKLIGYSYFEQMKDILPSFVLSATMFAVVYFISYVLPLHSVLVLIIQIIIGIALYVLGSVLFRLKGFAFVMDRIKGFLNARRKRANSK